MSMIDANWIPEAANFVHERNLSDKDKKKIKAEYLEALIKFTDIYAQTEIGEGIDIDIMKIALFINTPQFENQNLYYYHSIEDIYRELEILTIAGLPIWRFLKFSSYQQNIFESGYNDLLLSVKRRATNEHPCYGCVWYKTINTVIGKLTQCKRPITLRSHYFETRSRGFDPEDIKECEWLTTIETMPTDILNSDDIYEHDRRTFLREVEIAREDFKKYLYEDTFFIPKTLSEEEKIDLAEVPDILSEIGSAWNNKRTLSERQAELRKAMYIEGMIRFFEMFAQCEIGSDYTANIKNIALYVEEQNTQYNSFKDIMSIEDVYIDLENKIIDGFDVRKFVKYQD